MYFFLFYSKLHKCFHAYMFSENFMKPNIFCPRFCKIMFSGKITVQSCDLLLYIRERQFLPGEPPHLAYKFCCAFYENKQDLYCCKTKMIKFKFSCRKYAAGRATLSQRKLSSVATSWTQCSSCSSAWRISMAGCLSPMPFPTLPPPRTVSRSQRSRTLSH